MVPADIEIGQGQIEEDAVLVRAHLLAHDRDEQIDDDAGSAHQSEPEQLDPVLPVAYKYVVPEAFHHR